jgi:hypothetical protein
MCDAVEAAVGTHMRHRVEHCTICPPDLQGRLARLGMVAVMQPMAARYGRVASQIFFPVRERSDLAPHRGLMRAGVQVAFSSDLPVSPDPNPWPGIRVAVDDQINGISLVAALRAYTSGGAYASFEEACKGTLDAGMLADLQVYRDDPLEEARTSGGTGPAHSRAPGRNKTRNALEVRFLAHLGATRLGRHRLRHRRQPAAVPGRRVAVLRRVVSRSAEDATAVLAFAVPAALLPRRRRASGTSGLLVLMVARRVVVAASAWSMTVSPWQTRRKCPTSSCPSMRLRTMLTSARVLAFLAWACSCLIAARAVLSASLSLLST